MYQVVLSERFKKDLKKILRKNPELKSKIQKQVETLSINPSHKSLRTHKLAGTNNWSISINMNVRMIVSIRNEKILCTRIGSHDEIYL